MSTPFTYKFSHPDRLELWERDNIVNAIKKIRIVSDTIEKKKSQNRSLKAEEDELEDCVSKLVETVLGWAQRPRPTISQKEILENDVRSMIRAIFILAGEGIKDSELAASNGFSAELTTTRTILVIDRRTYCWYVSLLSILHLLSLAFLRYRVLFPMTPLQHTL
jgi:predicted RNase H-like nuclease (RuvC/YqgF family)